jgi:transposase InsO family protein
VNNDDKRRVPDRWSLLRFSVIGQLLSAPPAAGTLQRELEALTKRIWEHPVTGEPVQFGFSTIERWYRAARNEREDPVGVLRRKVRRDRGRREVMGTRLCEVLAAQYREHRSWSYQLHVDNLAALVRCDPSLGPMPSYATVRRHMKQQGMRPVHKPRNAEREGVIASQAAREQREVRSYEATHVHAIWHSDFHDGSRKVLLPDGSRVVPQLLAFIDDHSRLICHAQWYANEGVREYVHGFSQAIQKRGLPRLSYSDNGAAMTAAETLEGCAMLGIVADTTRAYSPEQNAKMECWWASVEGRLMAMIESVRELTLTGLNDYTWVWIEGDYHHKVHSEIGTTPVDRFLNAPSVGRPSPSSEQLRWAFRRKVTRKQRRSDGTFSLDGIRYEVPARYRLVDRLSIRYARWDLSCVDLYDERLGTRLCSVYPLDKAANAAGLRRRLEAPSGTPSATVPAAEGDGVAPRMSELMAHFAATGLPPAWLPLEHNSTTTAPGTGDSAEDDQHLREQP